MTLSDAILLVNTPGLKLDAATDWADLGFGRGLFTKALATVLAPGSSIFAIDTNPGLTNQETKNKVKIITKKNDFVKDQLSMPLLDGILMANSLHYVQDQPGFIRKISKLLKDTGCFIIIEYDTDMANRWVPYPLSFPTLISLFQKEGFAKHRLINSVPSVYQAARIYSVWFPSCEGGERA
ncbi:MAG TPA: methyltransferase domain-containing protein [Flavitalea sp.]|nr:methyltransferase domain-containing protein [Flavitalea sp.]